MPRIHHLLRIGSFLGLCLSLTFCSSTKNGKPTEGPSKLQKIYVSQAEPEEEALKSGKVQIRIRGNLPSPAYKFERFDVQVRGHVIEITPLASYDRNKMAAQVLVPFEEVCTVDNVKAGVYDVKVHGRNNVVSGKQIKINP